MAYGATSTRVLVVAGLASVAASASAHLVEVRMELAPDPGLDPGARVHYQRKKHAPSPRRGRRRLADVRQGMAVRGRPSRIAPRRRPRRARLPWSAGCASTGLHLPTLVAIAWLPRIPGPRGHRRHHRDRPTRHRRRTPGHPRKPRGCAGPCRPRRRHDRGGLTWPWRLCGSDAWIGQPTSRPTRPLPSGRDPRSPRPRVQPRPLTKRRGRELSKSLGSSLPPSSRARDWFPSAIS